MSRWGVWCLREDDRECFTICGLAIKVELARNLTSISSGSYFLQRYLETLMYFCMGKSPSYLWSYPVICSGCHHLGWLFQWEAGMMLCETVRWFVSLKTYKEHHKGLKFPKTSTRTTLHTHLGPHSVTLLSMVTQHGAPLLSSHWGIVEWSFTVKLWPFPSELFHVFKCRKKSWDSGLSGLGMCTWILRHQRQSQRQGFAFNWESLYQWSSCQFSASSSGIRPLCLL